MPDESIIAEVDIKLRRKLEVYFSPMHQVITAGHSGTNGSTTISH